MMEGSSVSFSSQVKREISFKEFSSLAKKALLAGFIKCNGFLRYSQGELSLDISSEVPEVADLLYHSIASLFPNPCRFSCVSSMGPKKAQRFHVLVSDPDSLLDGLGIREFTNRIPADLIVKEEGISAYLAGAFLASGYVNDPSTSNYHLEIAVADETYANRLSRLLNRAHSNNFVSKVAKRRNHHIVYLKKSEKISEFLVYIGAVEACMNFESARVDRDFANIENRLKNLDKANETKSGSAAKRQMEEIEFLREKDALSEIENPKIPLLCSLRIDHPTASLDQLAEMLSDEMGMSVSKSNINHLFRSIHQLYLQYKEKDAE